MGDDRTVIQQAGTTTPTATPQELEMQKLQLGQYQQTVGPQTQLQLQGMETLSKLFAGEDLPGMLGQMGAGITPEMTGEIAQQSIQDLPAMFQQMGVLEGGVAPSIMARTAGDVRRGAAEFNIGARQNLLNMALGGQAQVQQPLLAQSQMLSQSLAGLRSMATTGTQTQTQMNPFLRSFQQGLGSGLGGGMGGFLWGA